MRRPVVGVIGNAHRFENRFATQMVGERNLRAVADVAGALPLMFAGAPDITDIGALLDAVDGVVLTGARANVHPTRFRTEPHARHEPYDAASRRRGAGSDRRPASPAACRLFGICRGLQEMNVAFGGSLHPEIRELPGRMNHRMPRLENGEIHPDPTVVFADRHDVSLRSGRRLRASCSGARPSGSTRLHGQGILEPGKRVVVEGVAEDGTIEAIRIADARSFALGVQWHAEYDPQRNPDQPRAVSRPSARRYRRICGRAERASRLISTKQKALRQGAPSHVEASEARQITASSTCRIRPDAGSSRSVRLRSSSARYSCR